MTMNRTIRFLVLVFAAAFLQNSAAFVAPQPNFVRLTVAPTSSSSLYSSFPQPGDWAHGDVISDAIADRMKKEETDEDALVVRVMAGLTCATLALFIWMTSVTPQTSASSESTTAAPLPPPAQERVVEQPQEGNFDFMIDQSSGFFFLE